MQMERVLSDELFDYFRIDSQIDAELLIKLGELLAESFALNPIEMTFNISAEDLFPLSDISNFTAAGMSFAAFHRGSQQWAGVGCNSDFHSILCTKTDVVETTGRSPPSSALSILTDGSLMVHELECAVQKLQFSHLQHAGQVFHIDLIGVKPQFTGRGLASQLMRLALMEARNRGFGDVVLTATNACTLHIAVNKCGFVLSTEQRRYGSWRNVSGICSLAAIEYMYPKEALRMALLKL